MKKIALLLITCFLFMNNVLASNIENDLNTLKNQYNLLEEKVNNFDNSILNKTYPVGSIYITTTYSSKEEVANAIGGTWERYGNGKSLIGVDEKDELFNTVNKNGGVSEITLTEANLPSHSHKVTPLSGVTNETGSHNHSIPALTGTASSAGAHTHTRGTMDITGYIASTGGSEPKFGVPSGAFYEYGKVTYFSLTTNTNLASGSYRYDGFSFRASRNWTGATSSDGTHTHSVTTNASNTGDSGAHTHTFTTEESNSLETGGNTAFTNLQPYVTVYMYKRVA